MNKKLTTLKYQTWVQNNPTRVPLHARLDTKAWIKKEVSEEIAFEKRRAKIS